MFHEFPVAVFFVEWQYGGKYILLVARQCAGIVVRDIIDFVQNFLYFLHTDFGHIGSAVQNSVHSPYRYTSFFCYIFDSYLLGTFHIKS